MLKITAYFKRSSNNENNTKSTELSIETSKNEYKVTRTTPKSRSAKNKRTPRSKNKISPRRSPLEGFNILFKNFKKTPEESEDSRMEGDIATAKEEDKNVDYDDSLEIQEISENPPSSGSKMNAFEFLMMSRRKVIGSNSPGKELPEQEDKNKTSPSKILARKRLLQNWSDSIKVKRRKLDDNEVDKYIKVKLNTRKERMKSMLQIEDNSTDAMRSTPKSRKKRHSSRTSENIKKTEPNENIPANSEVVLIETETEEKKPEIMLSKSLSSGDDFESINTNVEIKTAKESSKLGHKKKSKDTTKSSSSSKCTKTWKMKIKLIDNDETSNSNPSDPQNDVIILDDCDDISETTLDKEKIQEINLESPETIEEISVIEEVNDCGRVLRNRTSLNKSKNIDYVYSSEESNDGFERRRKKAVKVAPVFAKVTPKPKIDPEVLEARRKFLMSDMPDSLRKKIEKKTSHENMDSEFDPFPKTSHITQEEKDHHLWNLPDPLLVIKSTTPFSYEPTKLLCQSLVNNSVIEPSRYKESEPIKCIKTIMRNMKLENSNYPVNRAFRLLKEKNGVINQVLKKTTPKRGRKQKKSSEKIATQNTDLQVDVENLMWTEKYKPRSSEDFFGNSQAVSTLKKWLERWKEVLETGRRKIQQVSSDSESDFTYSDAESIYDRSLSTTVVLTGPCGTGKSSSVYAVCNELGLNVLELNASSRRMGKQVIQELQEATRSHQVRKAKNGLESFTKKSIEKQKGDEEKHKSRKMCVLLIEDIDIVFDQDDGFINAITQISTTSKRPIVLTTTNEDSVYSQKFTNDFKTIRFHSLSSGSLGIWLQILCVLEGIFVDLSSIQELLEYNRGDLRKTILELQYWIQSGGQISKHKTLLDQIFDHNSNDERCSTPIFDDAEATSMKESEETPNNYRLHANILSDLMTFQLERFYNIPHLIDLKTLWWNIPKFLYPSKPETMTPESSKENRRKLKMVSDLFDSVADFDISYRKIGYKCDDPVCRKRWHCELQDSLEVEEKSTGFSINQELLELNHYLTNGYLDSCKNNLINQFSQEQRFCNMAVPGLDQERQLDNNHKYEKELLNPVPSLNVLDRKSVALDYLPCLRTIARTENKRAKNNVKRHNRFHNYLSNLNISCDTPILDFAIRTFSTQTCTK